MRQQLFQSGTAAFFVMTTVDQRRDAERIPSLCKNAAEHVFTNCNPAVLFTIKSHIKHRNIPEKNVEKQNVLQSFLRIGFEEAEHLCI